MSSADRQRGELGTKREPGPADRSAISLLRGERQRGQQSGQRNAVIKAALNRERMADTLRDAPILEQRVHQRHLGGRHDNGQAHGFPKRQHRQH